MQPRQPTEAELDRLSLECDAKVTWAEITGPEELPEIQPCPAAVILTAEGPVVAVAWEMNEIELAQLASGGTLWLTSWGGLPMHKIEVRDKP